MHHITSWQQFEKNFMIKKYRLINIKEIKNESINKMILFVELAPIIINKLLNDYTFFDSEKETFLFLSDQNIIDYLTIDPEEVKDINLDDFEIGNAILPNGSNVEVFRHNTYLQEFNKNKTLYSTAKHKPTDAVNSDKLELNPSFEINNKIGDIDNPEINFIVEIKTKNYTYEIWETTQPKGCFWDGLFEIRRIHIDKSLPIPVKSYSNEMSWDTLEECREYLKGGIGFNLFPDDDEEEEYEL